MSWLDVSTWFPGQEAGSEEHGDPPGPVGASEGWLTSTDVDVDTDYASGTAPRAADNENTARFSNARGGAADSSAGLRYMSEKYFSTEEPYGYSSSAGTSTKSYSTTGRAAALPVGYISSPEQGQPYVVRRSVSPPPMVHSTSSYAPPPSSREMEYRQARPEEMRYVGEQTMRLADTEGWARHVVDQVPVPTSRVNYRSVDEERISTVSHPSVTC
jgi:hypothetical protein